MLDAAEEQKARLRTEARGSDPWAGSSAQAFRADPRRELDGTLTALAERVEPDDVVIDVGGGAGRLGLPLALCCRELVNVDPSAGMHAVFDGLVHDAGIHNARFVEAAWPGGATGLSGDVVLAAHVTYFVREIVPFITALQHAARRRVMLVLRSTPPPMAQARLFEVIYGEPQAPVPGHRELLPVLWDLGLLPDVTALQAEVLGAGWPAPTREAALSRALDRIGALGNDRARAAADARFDDLFLSDPEGRFLPRQDPTRDLLITWSIT